MTSTTEPNTTTVIAKGSCLCKSITYEIKAQPRLSVLCHCTHCQKTSGSVMGAFLNFASEEDVQTSDPNSLLRWYDDKTDSDRILKRSFCSTCGSSLILKYADPGKGVTLSSGTIDNIKEEGLDEKWKPKAELFCERKRKWMPELEGTKKFERMVPGM